MVEREDYSLDPFKSTSTSTVSAIFAVRSVDTPDLKTTESTVFPSILGASPQSSMFASNVQRDGRTVIYVVIS